MRTKKLPNGFEIPVIGIGTFGMGGWHEKDTTNDRESIRAIKKAVILGYSHIDTAEMYGGGHTEELVGKAIKGFRKRLFITSKVSPEHLGYEQLLESARNSLSKLRTSYVNLYLIHVPNPDIPLKETIEAMDYLVDKGLVRNIGVSNFNIQEIKQAQKFARHDIVANEVKYNLFNPIDIETIQYCQRNDIVVIAHKPLGRGKITSENIATLSDMAAKHGKTEAQAVLSWLMSKKNVVTIVKALHSQHLRENFGALDFTLTKEEIKKLDRLVKTS